MRGNQNFLLEFQHENVAKVVWFEGEKKLSPKKLELKLYCFWNAYGEEGRWAHRWTHSMIWWSEGNAVEKMTHYTNVLTFIRHKFNMIRIFKLEYLILLPNWIERMTDTFQAFVIWKKFSFNSWFWCCATVSNWIHFLVFFYSILFSFVGFFSSFFVVTKSSASVSTVDRQKKEKN